MALFTVLLASPSSSSSSSRVIPTTFISRSVPIGRSSGSREGDLFRPSPFESLAVSPSLQLVLLVWPLTGLFWLLPPIPLPSGIRARRSCHTASSYLSCLTPLLLCFSILSIQFFSPCNSITLSHSCYFDCNAPTPLSSGFAFLLLNFLLLSSVLNQYFYSLLHPFLSFRRLSFTHHQKIKAYSLGSWVGGGGVVERGLILLPPKLTCTCQYISFITAHSSSIYDFVLSTEEDQPILVFQYAL